MNLEFSNQNKNKEWTVYLDNIGPSLNLLQTVNELGYKNLFEFQKTMIKKFFSSCFYPNKTKRCIVFDVDIDELKKEKEEQK